MFSCLRALVRPRSRAIIAKWHASHDRHCSRERERFLSTASRVPRVAENGDVYTPDGKERVAWLMQHNIGLYGELKKVHKLRYKHITVEMAGRHVLHYSDLNYFTTQGSSFTEAVCRRYLADSAKPLWWRTQALSSTTKPVVRNKATARLNAAFRQALQNAGYDTHGNRLPDQQHAPSGTRAITHLAGTVVIKAHSPVDVYKIPFKDLQTFCTAVVEGVEEALGQRPGDASRKSQPASRQHVQRLAGDSKSRGGGHRGAQAGRKLRR
ncbi:hypothetical protein KVR01_002277 [Diaporthe batatas]|uniref:uncharacterized protein n=1 Tax=Diaporthe batatas TaxID=748121 RepID=UPI001D046B1C|nr:uncharacterized protein KVR01_002277 [Diaporthe batatas]KAG8166588.1 hypothetical protein KVR01_002277 [Diaporthe batatas]